MEPTITRRGLLTGVAGAVGTAALAADKPVKEPFRYCLNTSTISGQKRKLAEVIDIAARAGYQAIEPWVRELDAHVKDGGDLKDIDKRIRDHGLTVESVIGFPQWIVDDDEKRAKGVEETKRCMGLAARIGGKRLACPPAGATDKPGLDLLKAAERYRVLLELGKKEGVVPQVEVWGHSKNLGRLGEAVLVAVESGHADACILPDVFHLYKGGSGFGGIQLLAGTAIHVLHVNDYPAKPARAEARDEHRIYPGDGVAPLNQLFRDLHAAGFRGALSLELFNRTYWGQDALEVSKTGLEKLKAVVSASLRS